MKKIKNIYDSNNEYVNNKKNNIKYFLKLCKYDVLPSALVASTLTVVETTAYTPSGVTDLLLFGGVVGTSLALAVNGAITGAKISKEKKEEIRTKIENEKEKKGKTI